MDKWLNNATRLWQVVDGDVILYDDIELFGLSFTGQSGDVVFLSAMPCPTLVEFPESSEWVVTLGDGEFKEEDIIVHVKGCTAKELHLGRLTIRYAEQSATVEIVLTAAFSEVWIR